MKKIFAITLPPPVKDIFTVPCLADSYSSEDEDSTTEIIELLCATGTLFRKELDQHKSHQYFVELMIEERFSTRAAFFKHGPNNAKLIFSISPDHSALYLNDHLAGKIDNNQEIPLLTFNQTAKDYLIVHQEYWRDELFPENKSGLVLNIMDRN